MAHETLVDVDTLAAQPHDASWRIFDCRFTLADPDAGAREHARATIPGAIYAHLDHDLSAPVIPGETGRHPLPSREGFAATLGRWGIRPQTQVVAFDDMGGAFAARLWWMLRWAGHRAVAVLDGGIGAWTGAGHALAPGKAFEGVPTRFELGEPLATWASASEVLAVIDDPTAVVLDARAAPRYRGENETTDPIAGHIAGARSAPFIENLGEGGRFRSPAQLRARFEERLAGTEPAKAITYCGSGVTACHNVLAMAHAGLDTPRLYAGSWSEWITDPSRPRAIGDEGG